MKKHYTTKEKLLEICKECAKEKGINGFGMRDVAHASGLALGTIYNYFTDKETMIIETLLSIWKDFISCIPNTESFHDYLERIINIVDDIESTYPNFINNHPRHITDSKIDKAKELMTKELQGIKEQIISVLNQDKMIRSDVFNSILTKENLARFTIKNILSAKTKEDKELLLQIVKCAIY